MCAVDRIRIDDPSYSLVYSVIVPTVGESLAGPLHRRRGSIRWVLGRVSPRGASQ
jgi:hypothetical protein